MNNRNADEIPNLISGGGEMGERIRRFDWSATVLGAIEEWSPSLRTAVQIMLNSRFAMFVWWGDDLTYFYNDAYAPTLGIRHPHALGASAREIWAEVWDDIEPQVAAVIERGAASWNEELLLFLERGGFPEETYHTFSYSPIYAENNQIGGLFCAVSEDTARVLNRRRLQTLRDLGERTLEESKTTETACRAAVEALAENPFDISFALVYLLDENGRKARLCSGVRFSNKNDFCPTIVDLENAATDIWNFRVVLDAGKSLTVEELTNKFGAVSGGAWADDWTTRAQVLPLARTGVQEFPAGFLVCGISPRLVFNDEYRGFMELVAGHIATAINSARAREEERQRTEALAQLDRAKTEFFSNVSHEFRTPLTLMLGNLEEVLQKDNAIPPAEKREIETAHRNSLRLLKLVNNLLDFSRFEAGRINATFEPTDLCKFTTELAGNFQSAVERAEIKFTVDCQGISEDVFVDREMWEKIVFNLISNAFKFTFTGEIKVVLRESDANIVLEVSDTGTGIAASDLPHVFERFYRVAGAASRTHESTGIGLSLVGELVRLHGGEIFAASEPGKGSTFTVTIPKGKKHLPPERIGEFRDLKTSANHATAYVNEINAIQANLETPSPVVSEISDGDCPLVLLADDNADMREYVRRLLEAADLRVVVVTDGAAALEFVEKSPDDNLPDLILSDVMMPNLNGFELLEKVRADERTKDIPFIMLSARAGEESKIEGLDAGASDYLVKPFSSNELLARVGSNLKFNRLRRESAEQIQSILESISDGFFAIDREWRFTYVNRAAETLINFKEKDLLGRTFWEVYPTVLGSPFEQIYRQAMHENIAGTVTDYFPLHKRFYETSVYPARAGVTVLFKDVTERVESENLLREREQFTQDVLDSLTMHISVLDKDGNITAINEAWKRFAIENGADWTMQSVGIGSNYLNVCRAASLKNGEDTEEAGLIYAGIRDVLSGARKFFSLEYPCHSPTAQRWFLLTASPLEHSADGGAVVAHLNVTNRRQAEEALRESEERYRTLFNSIDEGYCIIEVLFDEDEKPYNYRFVQVNPAFERQTGLTDSIGKTILDFAPQLEKHWFEIYGKVVLTGEAVRFENEAAELNRWYDVYAFRYGEPETRQVAVIFNDITKRKAVERERERLLKHEQDLRQTAEQTNRMKDEFLATVSHELRTPLNAILGWSQILATRKADAVTIARAIEVIYRSAKSQVQLIEDLLDVSRIITGKLRLETRPVELETIVQAAVETLRPAIDAKNIKLRKVFGDAGLISGDADRLQQVVWNLVSNAVKFTPENKRVTIDIEHAGNFAVLTVADEGIGIEPEILPFVFDRFRQADGTSTRKYGGLGLGLAIVRHLVELHGGEIRAESGGANQGAIFTISLPLYDAANVVRDTVDGDETPNENKAYKITKKSENYLAVKNRRVLVVDDEPTMLELLELSLRAAGATVESAASAADALEILRVQKFDLLISDIAMPGEDGFWLIEKLRGSPNELNAKISAIALTAYARTEDRQKILAAGFQMFVAKPIEPDALLGAIYELMGNQYQTN